MDGLFKYNVVKWVHLKNQNELLIKIVLEIFINDNNFNQSVVSSKEWHELMKYEKQIFY